MTGKASIYQQVIDAIASHLESCVNASGVEMPWYKGGEASNPTNAATRKEYRGINNLHLWVVGHRRKFDSNVWATFKQWQSLGAIVRKGEKGTVVIYYQPSQFVEVDGEEVKTRTVLKYSHVFNACQVDGYDIDAWLAAAPVSVIEPHARADALVKASGAVIRVGGSAACYWPKEDRIDMPDRERFQVNKESTSAWYATLMHELVHWSGHESRLKRRVAGAISHRDKAKEELIAEFGAAMLCSQLGIVNQPRPDHAPYIAHWFAQSRSDKTFLKDAIREAVAASEYLLKFDEKG